MNKFKQQSIESLTTQRLLCIPKQISEPQRDNSLGFVLTVKMRPMLLLSQSDFHMQLLKKLLERSSDDNINDHGKNKHLSTFS